MTYIKQHDIGSVGIDTENARNENARKYSYCCHAITYNLLDNITAHKSNYNWT